MVSTEPKKKVRPSTGGARDSSYQQNEKRGSSQGKGRDEEGKTASNGYFSALKQDKDFYTAKKRPSTGN